MGKIKSIKWVIDADIARSAGETEHPISRNCRTFLEHIQDNKHFLVMTAEIKQEWDKHESRYTTTWRKTMLAQKRMVVIRVEEADKLIHHLNTQDLTDNQAQALFKDAHLLDAALLADKHIASGDDTVRDIVAKVAVIEESLRELHWLNPKTFPDKLLIWSSGIFIFQGE